MREEVDDRERRGEEGERPAAAVKNKAPARTDLKRKRGRRPDWIKKGADVLVRSDDAVKGRPYVARVIDMHGEKEATVMWYYRPEDTVSAGTESWGGRDREPFHGKRELFESDHQDRIEVESIYAPCSVLRLFEYEEKVGWEVDEHGQRQRWKYNEDKELVFFYRFEYLSDHSVFKSNLRVPLYCRCRQPYNPDEREDMTQCASCREWFHLGCLSARERTDAEGRAGVAGHQFVCDDCAPPRAPPAP